MSRFVVGCGALVVAFWTALSGSILASERLMEKARTLEQLQPLPQGYSLMVVAGIAWNDYIDFIGHARMEVFRQYPYLYDGELVSELTYTRWFASLPNATAVIVLHAAKPVGFFTGCPFEDYGAHFLSSIDLFKKHGLDPKRYFYCAELIVLPEHRNLQIAKALAAAFIDHAKKLGYAAGCGVTESHDEHPLKPQNFRDLGSLWLRYGCQKTDMRVTASWLTIQPEGPSKRAEHKLNYWIKDF